VSQSELLWHHRHRYRKGKEKAPELVQRGYFFSEVRVTVVSAFHRGHLAQTA
jgi:hypothetical protein